METRPWAPFPQAISTSGRAVLAKVLSLEPLTDGNDTEGGKKKMFSGIGAMLSLDMQYLPQGFLQMIYLDTNGFDKNHYKFDYVRREFLGEVRTLVFDVTPLPKAGKGRFADASGSRTRISISSGSMARTQAARAPTTISILTAGA